MLFKYILSRYLHLLTDLMAGCVSGLAVCLRSTLEEIQRENPIFSFNHLLHHKRSFVSFLHLLYLLSLRYVLEKKIKGNIRST